MASHLSIPRFLLPQAGPVWPRANLGSRLQSLEPLVVRYASSNAAKGKPPGGGRPGHSPKAKPSPQPSPKPKPSNVLEKPEKFNPPSHGARLPSKGRQQPPQQHYGGSLTSEQLAAQRRTEYPGMPPPRNTWAHWFWNSRALHMTITMGTLASLAIFTAVENFKANTPFRDMLPEAADYLHHPFTSLRTSYEVWQLTALHESAVTSEKRKKKVDDVAKRSEYRKAHGLEQKGGFGNWTAKEDPQEQPSEPGQKREKWLGIF